jgi:hypothetical protein
MKINWQINTDDIKNFLITNWFKVTVLVFLFLILIYLIKSYNQLYSIAWGIWDVKSEIKYLNILLKK